MYIKKKFEAKKNENAVDVFGARKDDAMSRIETLHKLVSSFEPPAEDITDATRERRTPTIKLAALISKLQELRKDAGNVDVFINVPISATQSEERSIANVYNEGGYVAIYAEEA